MPIKSIYTKYFQKSKMFLYPLLGIKKGAKVVPSETYLAWDPYYIPVDMKLICLYHPKEKDVYEKFEKQILLKNNRLVDIKTIDDNNKLFIFDFADLKNDWSMFLEGKYSKINSTTKEKILYFFPESSANYVYMRSYLYPKAFFKDYAEILDVDETFLSSIGELCNIPDIKKETLILKENLQNVEIIN